MALASMAALWLCSAGAQTFAEPPITVTNSAAVRISPDIAEIVEMSRARATEAQVLQKIQTLPRLYNVSRGDADNMKRLGVPNKYVAAMRSHDKALQKIWKRDGAKPTGEAAMDPEGEAVFAPKIHGGSPLGLGNAPMRKEAPLVWLPPPAFTTNQPSAPSGKQWTSTTIVEHTPPPSQLERRPGAPGADYVWISGHWVWLEGAWFWQPGKWWQKPSPAAQWMDGYWQRHARGYIWMPGSWK